MRALAAETAKPASPSTRSAPASSRPTCWRSRSQRIVAKTGRSADEARASLASTNPQGRFVQPEEVAAAVLWLCSDARGSITGQAISISGGETW